MIGVGLLISGFWLMFHNPVLDDGVLRDGTTQDNWRCLAPYDIVLFHSDNSNGGAEVINNATVKARCDSAARRQFVAGSVTGVAALAALGGALAISGRATTIDGGVGGRRIDPAA